MAEPQDNINPSHYQKGEIEVIDFIIDQDMDYFTASAVKYLCRWRDKHKGGGQVDDLRKARWFIEKLISTLIDKDIK